MKQPALTKENTEHILQVMETIHKEQRMQKGHYGELIWDLLGLVMVLRGYSPDGGLTEQRKNYLGNGTKALVDCNQDKIQSVIASLALLPTGHDAIELSKIGMGFVADMLPQARTFLVDKDFQSITLAVVVCPKCSRMFDLSDPTDSQEWSCGHDCEAPG